MEGNSRWQQLGKISFIKIDDNLIARFAIYRLQFNPLDNDDHFSSRASNLGSCSFEASVLTIAPTRLYTKAAGMDS
jgi:hypothetical protein